ncbi:MAG: tetratricopeptide repeat protein [Opitutaceae bacterium]
MKRLLLFAVFLPLPFATASEMGKPDLSGPEFQKRFAGSYGVLSDREPQITEVEVALLEKISPMIEQNPDTAVSMLESMLADGKPVSAAFNHILGNLYLSADRYNQAETEFLNAIKKFPDFQRAWNSLGTLKMQEESYGAAAEALARSVELGAADAQTYGMLGYALLQTRQFLASEMAYNMALLRAPGETRWLEGKARILAESGRFEETLAATDELLRKHPDNLEYWRLQGNAHLGLGHMEETARSLEVARLVGRLDAGALYLLGNVYMKLDIPEKALDSYLAALEEQPQSTPGNLLNVARSLLGDEQFELARRLVATLQPNNENWTKADRLYFELIGGRIALNDGDKEAALASFSRVLDIDPTNVECLFRASQLHTDMGRFDKARYYLEKIQGDATYEYAAQIFLARMLINEGRLDESLTCLRKAIRLTPSAELEKLYNQVRVAAQTQS